MVKEMSNEIIDRVQRIASPVLSDGGMELVDIEYRREARGWVLRLYIDRKGGVTLADCTRVSQDLGRILDVEDFILNPYTLEVSSPGLDRPLKKEEDFIKYRGRLIKVKTSHPVGIRRQFKGRLLGLSEGQIEIETDGEVFRIPLCDVARANLEIEQDVLRKERN